MGLEEIYMPDIAEDISVLPLEASGEEYIPAPEDDLPTIEF